MKFKYLSHLDVTPITVEVEGEMSEGGAPVSTVIYTGKCRVTDKSIIKADGDGLSRHYVTIITVGGDIAPTLPEISGYATLDSVKYKIAKSLRPRNPDGTVCFTKLELI